MGVSLSIMQKANQQALLQSTNVGLLAIRRIELNYYAGFYTVFGSQAAIIGGFSYGSMCQVLPDGHNSDPYPDGIGDVGYHVVLKLYWVTSAICVCAALHLVFVTILLQVLGPGKGSYYFIICFPQYVLCLCILMFLHHPNTPPHYQQYLIAFLFFSLLACLVFLQDWRISDPWAL